MKGVLFYEKHKKRISKNGLKLPSTKLKKKLPTIIFKQLFLKIFNEEHCLKYKCWLILAFCCGLRVDEIAKIRIENIYPNEHKTVPYELNELFLYNEKICYNILFKTTSASILELADDPKWLGAKVGITSILHTWGQPMEFHPQKIVNGFHVIKIIFLKYKF